MTLFVNVLSMSKQHLSIRYIGTLISSGIFAIRRPNVGAPFLTGSLLCGCCDYCRCETTAKMVEVVRYSKRVQVTGRVRAVLSLGPPRSAVLDAEPPASSARRTKSLSNMFSELKLRPEILVKQYGRVACRNQFPRKR